MFKVAIVIPVFNDYSSLNQLLFNLNKLIEGINNDQIKFDVHVVDDFSTQRKKIIIQPLFSEIFLTSLVRNLGHQRAIAIGLTYVNEFYNYDAVVVMDSYGEDNPKYIKNMLLSLQNNPSSIIVASRTIRSEGIIFTTYYKFYKLLFRVLTGYNIDFGNYCLIPGFIVPTLTHTSGLWNHLAATITKSKISIVRVPTVRSKRYHGSSKMNFSSLVLHGLSSISIFLDILAVRLLILFFSLGLIVGVGITIVIYLKLFTEMAIPGWATSAVGILTVVLIQLFTATVIITFWVLNKRESRAILPENDVLCFVKNHQQYK